MCPAFFAGTILRVYAKFACLSGNYVLECGLA